MNTRLSKIFIIILSFPLLLVAQNTPSERILEMKNSFALGLYQKGLEIASELMSQQQYGDVREEAVFFIAEYFFTSALLIDENEIKFDYFIKAYTYYLTHLNDYPNSKNSNIVDKRIVYLNSISNEYSFLRNLLDVYENDVVLVRKNLNLLPWDTQIQVELLLPATYQDCMIRKQTRRYLGLMMTRYGEARHHTKVWQPLWLSY